MLLTFESTVTVFRKVQQIREEYRLYVLQGDANRISVEDLHRVIQEMYQITILKREVPFEGVMLRGLAERYGDKFIVRVKRNQELDSKRFAAVKEMCHPVVDQEEDWSPRGVETLGDLLSEYAIKNGEEASRVAQSEVLAELAAMELMYPFECREPDLRKLREGATTRVRIANYHGMPVSIIDRALSKSYHEGIATVIWSQLG